jgi:hypothetical protein
MGKKFNLWKEVKLEKFSQLYQTFVLKFFTADLLAETFVLGEKPELPQKYSATGSGASEVTLEPSSFPYSSFDPMAIALIHHPRMMANSNDSLSSVINLSVHS